MWSFYCDIIFSLRLDLIWDNSSKLNVQMKPVEPLLDAGAQVQQMLTAECLDDYAGKFILKTLKKNDLIINFFILF